MRVISGSARGRRLREPRGEETRPTTDKVKESLFNIIQFEIEGRRVLDLFAGTGQLGIEALSRGAASCCFVERSREALALVRENVALCSFQDRARILGEEAISYLKRCRERYDLIFLDPPYESGLLGESLEAVAAIDILSEHGIIVCETARERPLPDLPEALAWGRSYRYGKIQLLLCGRREKGRWAGHENRDLSGQL